MSTYRVWTADAAAPITADSGFFTADGGIPLVKGKMPYLFGFELPIAQDLLQQAGILKLSALGYFSVWPVTVKWLSGTGQSAEIVVSQVPAFGANVAVNAPVTLGVAELPISVAYP